MLDRINLNITEEDISFVEKRFGFNFNKGQKDIIRFWENADIQACPGSGKTTTLAAKLIILANKLPKSFKQGICVITHTNVAVAEIKHKLGSYSNFYDTYPNHFGTIQSVVDKFFTIPAFKNEYKYSPTIVDSESYCREIDKFQSLYKTAMFLSTKNIDEIGYLSYNRYNFEVSKNINQAEPFSVNGISVEKMTDHLLKIKHAKDTLLSRGFLKYDEAYSLAFKYLRENKSIQSLFHKRFPIVFIDEMQDMEIHQSDFINCLTEGTTSIVQKIGDINQSIYNYVQSDSIDIWKPKINVALQLTETARISNNVVNVIKNICVYPQNDMKGWDNDAPINPTIIVFDDATILKVKEKFGELLIQYNLHKGLGCKAIGARLSDSRLNINSYWTEFERNSNNGDFHNFSSFINQIAHTLGKTNNIKDARRLYLILICKCMKICMIRSPLTTHYFTPFTLMAYLESEHFEMYKITNINLLTWIKLKTNRDTIQEQFKNYIQELISIFNSANGGAIESFFSDETTSNINANNNMIYKFKVGEEEVDIHFDTIHGVKGETHSATLYLETYNRTYDIGGKILEFIISSEKKQNTYRKNDAFRRKLPMAYVAMSRATKFLCIAVHRDRYSENYKRYFESDGNWDVVHI